MTATSHDVARMAGVSQPTVSRALRGEPGVSPATRERIQRAARALSYVPSETGRSLSTRATRRIGVVAADLTNPFYPELIEPLRAGLDRLGYRLLLIPDHDAHPLQVESLADGSLDGVVLTTSRLGAALPHQLSARGIPYVLVNREVDAAVADSCVVDNYSGARQAADLLCDLGHRRIAGIFGPDTTSTGRDRERGLRDGLSERGVGLPASRVRRGDFTYETGRAGMMRLLELAAPPTAVFCGNDVLAMGAISGAVAHGMRLPDDLTVVGFDDIAMASWDVFCLTTIRCDLAGLAEAAIRLLVARIADRERPVERVVLTPDVVLRGTHGPPPARRATG